MAEDEFCYLTTIGRRTGETHTIEIWYAREGNSVYLLAGEAERSDWVRNIKADQTVGLRIGEERWVATGRVVTDREEDALARKLLLEKYAPGYSEDLTEWGQTALPVAIDFPAEG